MNNYTNEQIYKYGIRDIPGYEGLYAVTSCGRVWSYKSKKFLKPSKDKDGYLQLNLYKEGKKKTCRLHRLVLETYHPIEGMEKLQCNHKSEIKEHNYLNNLEWCDAKYNVNYGTRNKRSAAAISKKVRCIETNIIYESATEAGRQTGIDNSSISKACRGKQKTAGSYHWMFEEDFQDMLTAELLEAAFLNEEEVEEEGADMVTICGQPLNDYLAMNEVSY